MWEPVIGELASFCLLALPPWGPLSWSKMAGDHVHIPGGKVEGEVGSFLKLEDSTQEFSQNCII